MRIAIFTTGIYPYIAGGIQKHSYYLAKYLAKNKIYVDLYHYVLCDQPLVENLKGFDKEELKYITNFCFHFDRSGRFPGHYIVESYNISKRYYAVFLNNNNVDFVYAQGFSGWHYAKKKYYGEKLPKIGVNFHGLNMFQRAFSIKSKLEQLIFYYPVKQCLFYSDYIYSLGGKLTNLLVGLGYSDKKIIVTPIGIDASWLVPSVPNKRKSKIRSFVFIGRYEERKGINELLIVLKELLDSFEFKFHFIGPIPENKQVASSKIFYHGMIKDEEAIKKILKKMDIIVVPSYSEGMPTVILEAMASGCAVIATDVGAVGEQVDSSNGWIISPRDIALLKSTMVDAMRLPEKELFKKKNSSIQRIIDKFLWDKVIAKTVKNVTRY